MNPTPTSQPQPSALPLVHRLTRGVALFAVALLAFLAVSERYALPALLAMRLPDTTLTPENVLPRKQERESELQALDAGREERIVTHDPLQVFLRTEQERRTLLFNVLDAALRTARETTGRGTVVTLQQVSVDVTQGTVTLEGDLSSPLPGTMTALAAFSDALSALDHVASVDVSPFTRTEGPEKTYVSPFSFTLHAR